MRFYDSWFVVISLEWSGKYYLYSCNDIFSFSGKLWVTLYGEVSQSFLLPTVAWIYRNIVIAFVWLAYHVCLLCSKCSLCKTGKVYVACIILSHIIECKIHLSTFIVKSSINIVLLILTAALVHSLNIIFQITSYGWPQISSPEQVCNTLCKAVCIIIVREIYSIDLMISSWKNYHKC